MGAHAPIRRGKSIRAPSLRSTARRAAKWSPIAAATAALLASGQGNLSSGEAGRGRMLEAASASDCPERSSQVSSAHAA